MSKPQQLPPAVGQAIKHIFDKLNMAKRSATLSYGSTVAETKQRYDLEHVHALLSTELAVRALQQVLFREMGAGEGEDE